MMTEALGSATTLDNSSLEIFATKFDRHRQFVRLACRGLFRFLLTTTLVFALYGTLKGYEHHGLIGKAGKRLFNTLVTGLSMALGISLASSFKAVALDLRWFILSRKERPIEEVNVSSFLEEALLTNLGQFHLGLWQSNSSHCSRCKICKEDETWTCAVLCSLGSFQPCKTSPSISYCLVLIIYQAAQGGVAMLSLTFSLSPSLSGDPSTPVPGQVVFTNMNQSFGAAVDIGSLESSQLAAHTVSDIL
jgi:hypothetical protein